MRRDEQTEVLVVGAGPVGMLSALLLSREGVRVRIIDQEWRTTSRTYACALHPRTLKLLDSLGITREALSVGRLIETVAFYEGTKRRAETKLSRLPVDFPYLVVLPQSTFEQILEQKLRKDGTIRIDWNHQLSGLRDNGHSVAAVIDELGISAKGYAVPEMDWSVQSSAETSAAYVVGADGPNSFVAQSLGLAQEKVGDSEFYAVYEFQSDWDCGNELRVVLDSGTTSVLWPLPGNRFRWSFQLREEHLRDFPAKERTPVTIGDPASEASNREFVKKLIRERAPWFEGPIQEIAWSADVEFNCRVASRFGQQRCWLAGDAVHQTSPAAMQSLNLGLLEAERLANSLTMILRENAAPDVLQSYEQDCRREWRRLLGLEGTLKARAKTDSWVNQRRSRLLSSLPASGEDLRNLLGQLELDFS